MDTRTQASRKNCGVKIQKKMYALFLWSYGKWTACKPKLHSSENENFANCFAYEIKKFLFIPIGSLTPPSWITISPIAKSVPSKSTQNLVKISILFLFACRCDTDIMFGNNNHLDTLMVLSGVTSVTDLRALEQQKPAPERGMIPKYYTDSIKDLLL